ncbi:phage tail protein [Erwinia sp. E602]|uniref:phage tail protein n=1 Tax=Erwinia sp. E602 TaxID=2675378 RepID=UPI001BACE834|nr:phage tail protein [Erwinia sp. E602]QUG76372.1 phage tail protein [Erwinia sp. E602]
MKKAELLRDALIAGNTWCRANPEAITVWVEKVGIETQATGEASFMYSYTIQALATDFPGDVDDLMLPLLGWVWEQQPDLLLNPDSNRKIEFEADIISDDTADFLFRVPVWERVIVTKTGGVVTAEHLSESAMRINSSEWETVFDPASEGNKA